MIWDCHSPKLTELRNVLVELSVFQAPEERRKLVGALPFASDIEDRTAAITHVEEIVKVCARNLTGFDVLLEALERFETEPLDVVYETLDRFQAEYASLITFSESRQLKLIVDPPNRDLVSDIVAAEAYKRANPLIPMQGRIQHGRRFVRALEHLAKLCHIAPVQGPLFAFLEDCRPCLELPDVCEPLVVWEQEVANRLKLDLVTIRATVRNKAGGAPPAVPTLAPEVPMPTRAVFISYAHADNESRNPKERWLDRFVEFLKPLVRQEDFTLCSDQDIKIGENWHQHIQAHLNGAKAVVLLISPAFLGSDYIASSELPAILKNASDQGVRIFPILISPSMYKRAKYKYPDPKTGPQEFTLASIQAANPPSETLIEMTEGAQNRVLEKVADQLADLLSANP
jgi:hypothetical protein